MDNYGLLNYFFKYCFYIGFLSIGIVSLYLLFTKGIKMLIPIWSYQWLSKREKIFIFIAIILLFVGLIGQNILISYF